MNHSYFMIVMIIDMDTLNAFSFLTSTQLRTVEIIPNIGRTVGNWQIGADLNAKVDIT